MAPKRPASASVSADLNDFIAPETDGGAEPVAKKQKRKSGGAVEKEVKGKGKAEGKGKGKGDGGKKAKGGEIGGGGKRDDGKGGGEFWEVSCG